MELKVELLKDRYKWSYDNKGKEKNAQSATFKYLKSVEIKSYYFSNIKRDPCGSKREK